MASIPNNASLSSNSNYSSESRKQKRATYRIERSYNAYIPMPSKPRMSRRQRKTVQCALRRYLASKQILRLRGEELKSFEAASIPKTHWQAMEPELKKEVPAPELRKSIVGLFEKKLTESTAEWHDDQVPFAADFGSNLKFSSFFKDVEPQFGACKSSDRDTCQSIIKDFANFDEINFSKFDFAKEDVQLPVYLNRSSNVMAISKDLIVQRAEYLAKQIAEKSKELLTEMENREELKSSIDSNQRVIQHILGGIKEKKKPKRTFFGFQF